MNTREEQLKSLDRLLTIMDELREKCPWDKKQTFESLKHLTIEEVYELGDAISENDCNEVKKELGDLLLHIFFYSKIGSETYNFDIGDVANAISDKLIFRHPHIYGDTEVSSVDEVLNNWEKLKLKEGNTSVLGGVPKSLPAMIKSFRIQDKAKGVGFDWASKKEVWEKVEEEIGEFKAEEESGDLDKMEQEFGDVLFSMINYARFLGINPETALERTNKKFINRFQFIEEKAKENEKLIHNLSLNEMEFFWNLSKDKF
ncbi:nucleoside triphosphate pyrophosphohydrolase [Myroides guanonis]|uniref:Nucleoside triphosphate pyrophosphohydrolase n=1 Tax=Myroides guanonis TaxID=1150112 RepID=A0A1I3R740_9FLAO|nr:nucleoside triphosphate pyrophosphohydrolase [Myroides guanonis]SFJ41231.1 XTP/dITP diphosphohydrolase [Myroides guanonis]